MKNKKPNEARKFQFPGWFVKYRWWIISILGFFLLALEIAELIVRGANLVDQTEIFIYLGFLAIIGTLIEMMLKTLSGQNQIVSLLDYRHRLSLELIKHEDWDSLANELARFPSTVASVSQTALYVRSTTTGRLDLAATWNDGALNPGLKQHFLVCQGCLKNRTQEDFLYRPCETDADLASGEVLCFQIIYGHQLLALLHMRLEPGEVLTKVQRDILWNIREEMAVALKAGLDHKHLAELQMTQAALSERRNVSHYLHDHLGQNLGYINLKLNQILSEKSELSLQHVRPDLEHMREAVNQSYEIVRGKLESAQPETTPLLSNYLQEHARKVSARAGFEVTFTTKGNPIPLQTDVQRAVFYVFQEALGNIEKHAQATKVEVVTIWSQGSLNILVRDNGKGFTPTLVQTDKHFGLQIMRERIAKVDGWIETNSSPDSGTTVSISVPIQLLEKENNQGV